MTLLEKAKVIGSAQRPQYALSKNSIEEAELMIAWVMGEVDNHQVAKVLGIKAVNSVPTKVGPSLREMAKFGRLNLSIKPAPFAEEAEL